MKIIRRLLYGKKPQKQTAVNFTPVNDKYGDGTDFSVEKDANTDVNTDANNDVSNKVSTSLKTFPSDNQSMSKIIDENFSTDMFTPTTPQMRFETLIANIEGGKMNVYALPVFHGEDQTIATATPVTKVDSVKTTQITPPWSILGVFMKEMNSPKTNHVASINDLASHDKTYRNASLFHALSNTHHMTVDKVLKVLLHKFLHKVVNKNKHSRKWRDDDNKERPHHYENVNDALKSLSNADLDRFADYARLRLTHRQNSHTSQGISTMSDRPLLYIRENPQQISTLTETIFPSLLYSVTSTEERMLGR